MISQTDIERYLDDWLGNTPMDPADRVVVSVAVRIQREDQRPAPLFTWGRATTFARLAAGAAAVVLMAVIGFAILRPGPGPGQLVSPSPAGPSPSPSTTPAASPSPTPNSIGVSVVGGLPDGWTITVSGLLGFNIEADGASMSVELLTNRRVMDKGCALGPQTGVGRTANAIISAIADRRGLVAESLAPADVGGFHGRQVDVHLDVTVGETCPGEGTPFVPLLGIDNAGFWDFVGLGGTEHMRLIGLDVPDGQNVVIFIVASDATAFDRFVDDATTIVNNLVFEIGS